MHFLFMAFTNLQWTHILLWNCYPSKFSMCVYVKKVKKEREKVREKEREKVRVNLSEC